MWRFGAGAATRGGSGRTGRERPHGAGWSKKDGGTGPARAYRIGERYDRAGGSGRSGAGRDGTGRRQARWRPGLYASLTKEAAVDTVPPGRVMCETTR